MPAAGVTAERLIDPVYVDGGWYSVVPQRDPTALLPSSRGTYLLSDRGAGVRPIVFRGPQSAIYETLAANAGETIENVPDSRPEKPEDWWTKPEHWSEDTTSERPPIHEYGDNPIFAGFVKDPGVKPGLHLINDSGTRALKQIANLGMRFNYAGPAPGSAVGAAIKGLKASSTVQKKVTGLIGLIKARNTSKYAKAPADMAELILAHKDSQKTMLKITNHPEKGLTKVGNGSVKLGAIAYILKRGQRPG